MLPIQYMRYQRVHESMHLFIRNQRCKFSTGLLIQFDNDSLVNSSNAQWISKHLDVWRRSFSVWLSHSCSVHYHHLHFQHGCSIYSPPTLHFSPQQVPFGATFVLILTLWLYLYSHHSLSLAITSHRWRMYTQRTRMCSEVRQKEKLLS